jgi:O-antigen/teichoic acid export membrane protein
MEAPASRREGQGGDKASVLAAISDRTIRGALAMILRQAILIPIRLVANILLARQLAPADFGAYAIAIFFISTATLFTDVD